MLFKNLMFYRITAAVDFDPVLLANRLTEFAFVPCGSQDVARAGFVAPIHGTEELTLRGQTSDQQLFCLKIQQKIMPSAAVAEVLEAKVTAIEKEELRKVGRKERKQIKEEIIHDLLPKALLRSIRIYAYISFAEGLVVIDTSSRARAENVLSQLREAIGKLPVEPIRPSLGISQTLTSWVRSGQTPINFALGEKCDLRDSQESANTVRVRGQDLSGEEVNALLEAGKEVVSLELRWHLASVAFVLKDDLSLRRLQFADELIESARDSDIEDINDMALADFILLTATVTRLHTDIAAHFCDPSA